MDANEGKSHTDAARTATRKLPEDVQRHILVARYLRTRYVWVDCLCIVYTEAELGVIWRQSAVVSSGKDITHASDRLPALSGLAKRFLSSGMPAPYLAGIWLANAHRELCWRA